MRVSKIELGTPEMLTSYNIAPTTHQPVIRHTRDGAGRKMLLMRWVLVPFFAKSLTDFKGFSTFNAKAGTLRSPRHGVNRSIATAAALCRRTAIMNGKCSIPTPRDRRSRRTSSP